MGDFRVGSSDADNNESNIYCRELICKIFDNRSTCNLVDVYLVPEINNPGLTLKIPAHKLIIKNSQFFANLLEINSSNSIQGQGPVDLQLESDPISTEFILRYVYTGQLDLNGQNLMKLIQASKYFELPNLAQKCLLFLQKDESYLNVENWLDSFRFAISMTEGARGFQLKIFEFLRSNVGHLFQSDDLSTLDFTEIKILLEPSNRVFPTHKDYNKVILKWVAFQADSREQYIDELSELKWDDTIVVDLAADNENLIDQNVQIQQNNQNDQIEIQMVKRARLSVHHQIIFLVENEDPIPKSLYTFSFEDQKVSKLADMPINSGHFGLVTTKNKLFLLGGYNKNDCEKYEETYSLNLIQQEPSSVSQLWKREINLFQKLNLFSTINVKESIYVVGGESYIRYSIPSIYLLTLDENENAQKWTLFCKMKMARYRAGVAVLNNVMYISGGIGRNLEDITNKGSTSDSFELVNLDTKIGRNLPNMTKKICDHQLVAFNDKLYAIGGLSYDHGKKIHLKSRSIEIYDPVSENWTIGVGNSMHDARSGFGTNMEKFLIVYKELQMILYRFERVVHMNIEYVAFTTERNIFVLGGNKGDQTMEKFDSLTNSWSRISSL